MDNSRGRRRAPGTSFRTREGPATSGGSYADLGRDTIGPVGNFFRPGQAEPNDRLNDCDLIDLVSRFKSLSALVSDKVVRPGFGKRSAMITLRANFFELNYFDNVMLYDCSIKIEPAFRSEERELQARLMDLFQRSKELAPFVHKIAHDSAQRLITRKTMPQSFSATITMYDGGEGEPCSDGNAYTVKLLHPMELSSVGLARSLQGDDLNYSLIPILPAFNLVVTSYAVRTAVCTGGKNTYYYPSSYEQSQSPLQSGVNLMFLKGSFATICQVYSTLKVNINLYMNAVYAPYSRPTHTTFESVRQSHGSTIPVKFYRRVRISMTYLGRSKAVTSMVLMPLSNKTKHISTGLRTTYDMELGKSSLCTMMSNIRRKEGQDQYFLNLALKLSNMLRGDDLSLEPGSLCWSKNNMFLRMDMTPSGAGCLKGIPSFVAVVASCDIDFMRYPGSLALQEYKRETVTNVKMMIQQLNECKNGTKAFPECVVVLRSGVSQSQTQQVWKAGIVKIRNALRELAVYKPKLTLVIFGKGQYSRFYPTNARGADKSPSSRAETVVNRGVTETCDFEFFLHLHAAPHVSIHAIRCTFIVDEDKFNANDLQRGVDDVSHPLAPTTESVSLTPPAFLAEPCVRTSQTQCAQDYAYDREKFSAERMRGRLRDEGSFFGVEGVHDDSKNDLPVYPNNTSQWADLTCL